MQKSDNNFSLLLNRDESKNIPDTYCNLSCKTETVHSAGNRFDFALGLMISFPNHNISSVPRMQHSLPKSTLMLF